MKNLCYLMLLALAFLFYGCREELEMTTKYHAEKGMINYGISKQIFLNSKFSNNLNNKNLKVTSLSITSNDLLGRLDLDNAVISSKNNIEIIHTPIKTPTHYKRDLLTISNTNTSEAILLTYPNPANRDHFYITKLNGDFVKEVTIDQNGKEVIQNKNEKNISTKNTDECAIDIFFTCSEGIHSYDFGNAHKCTFWTNPGGTPPRQFTISGICIGGGSTGGIDDGGNPSGGTGGGGFTTPPTGGGNPRDFTNGNCLENIDCDTCNLQGDLNEDCFLTKNERLFNALLIELLTEQKLWLDNNHGFKMMMFNYLSDQNFSQQSIHFFNWSVSFGMQNPDVSWQQFENWFINGYSTEYKSKLSLLSSAEMQEFVNINKELDASPYDEEFVKETNEAFVAFTAYADIENMTDAQIENVLNNNCCAGLFIQQFTLEKSRLIVANYHFNRKYYPEWSKAKCFWEASREVIQLVLDLGGLIPVVGEVCDLTNATIYAIYGDGLNASLSAAGSIPIAGWFATGTKYGIKVVNATDIASRQVLKWIVGTDGVIKFGYRSQLRKVLKLTDKTKQAHHIIPWSNDIQTHSVVQKAAKSAHAFHLNEALNGIAIASWRNQPNHTIYNTKIFNKLQAFKSSNPNATPQECYNFISDLISDIRSWVISNPNSHLNDLILP